MLCVESPTAQNSKVVEVVETFEFIWSEDTPIQFSEQVLYVLCFVSVFGKYECTVIADTVLIFLRRLQLRMDSKFALMISDNISDSSAHLSPFEFSSSLTKKFRTVPLHERTYVMYCTSVQTNRTTCGKSIFLQNHT